MKTKNIIENGKQDRCLFAFERFEIYQRAVDFANDIHDLTKKYPYPEKKEIGSQLRRASNSISLNLAEGFSNYYKKDKKKFFRYARGSVYECVPALKISLRQKYIGIDEHKELYQECYEMSRRISGLINSVDNRLESNKKSSNK